MKYRKKPVVIDAVQWFKKGDHPAVTNAALTGMPIYWIDTWKGKVTVLPGDYIITSVQGEYHPCKPDIFEMTYEPVEEQA